MDLVTVVAGVTCSRKPRVESHDSLFNEKNKSDIFLVVFLGILLSIAEG